MRIPLKVGLRVKEDQPFIGKVTWHLGRGVCNILSANQIFVGINYVEIKWKLSTIPNNLTCSWCGLDFKRLQADKGWLNSNGLDEIEFWQKLFNLNNIFKVILNPPNPWIIHNHTILVISCWLWGSNQPEMLSEKNAL